METGSKTSSRAYTNKEIYGSPTSRWVNYLSVRKGLEVRSKNFEFPLYSEDVRTFMNSKDHGAIDAKSVFSWYSNDKEDNILFSNKDELSTHAKGKSPGAFMRWTNSLNEANAMLLAVANCDSFLIVALNRIVNEEEIILFNPMGMVASYSTSASKRKLGEISPEKRVSPPQKTFKTSPHERLTKSLQKTIVSPNRQLQIRKEREADEDELQTQIHLAESEEDSQRDDLSPIKYRSEFKDEEKNSIETTKNFINTFVRHESQEKVKSRSPSPEKRSQTQSQQNSYRISLSPPEIPFRFARPFSSHEISPVVPLVFSPIREPEPLTPSPPSSPLSVPPLPVTPLRSTDLEPVSPLSSPEREIPSFDLEGKTDESEESEEKEQEQDIEVAEVNTQNFLKMASSQKVETWCDDLEAYAISTMRKKNSQFIVAMREDTIIAFTVFSVNNRRNSVIIDFHLACVNPQFRGKRVTALFLKYLAEKYPTSEIHSEPKHPAISRVNKELGGIVAESLVITKASDIVKKISQEATRKEEKQNPEIVAPASLSQLLPDDIPINNISALPSDRNGITPTDSSPLQRLNTLSPSDTASEESEFDPFDDPLGMMNPWQPDPSEEQLQNWEDTMRATLRDEAIIRADKITADQEEKEASLEEQTSKAEISPGSTATNPIAIDDEGEDESSEELERMIDRKNPKVKNSFQRAKEESLKLGQPDFSDETGMQVVDLDRPCLVALNLTEVAERIHTSEEDILPTEEASPEIPSHTLGEMKAILEAVTPMKSSREASPSFPESSPSSKEKKRSKKQVSKLIFTEEEAERREVRMGLSDSTLEQENIERKSEQAILRELKEVKIKKAEERRKSMRQPKKPMEEDIASVRLQMKRITVPVNLVPSESGARILLDLNNVGNRYQLMAAIRESNKNLESSGNSSYQTLSYANIQKMLVCLVTIFKMDKYSRFIDLGSGYGNIVFQAALTWQLQAAHGIDIGLQGMAYYQGKDLILPLDKVIYYCSILTKEMVATKIPAVREQMNKVLFYFGDANAYNIKDYTHIISFNLLWDTGDFHGIMAQMLAPTSKMVVYGSVKNLHAMKPRPVSVNVSPEDSESDRILVDTLKRRLQVVQKISLQGGVGKTFTMFFYVRVDDVPLYHGIDMEHLEKNYKELREKINGNDIDVMHNFHMFSLSPTYPKSPEQYSGQILSPSQARPRISSQSFASHKKSSSGHGRRRKSTRDNTDRDECLIS